MREKEYRLFDKLGSGKDISYSKREIFRCGELPHVDFCREVQAVCFRDRYGLGSLDGGGIYAVG